MSLHHYDRGQVIWKPVIFSKLLFVFTFFFFIRSEKILGSLLLYQTRLQNLQILEETIHGHCATASVKISKTFKYIFFYFHVQKVKYRLLWTVFLLYLCFLLSSASQLFLCFLLWFKWVCHVLGPSICASIDHITAMTIISEGTIISVVDVSLDVQFQKHTFRSEVAHDHNQQYLCNQSQT